MATRPKWTDADIEGALDAARDKIISRLEEKGNGSFVSSHEIYGVVAEEFHELLHAIEERAGAFPIGDELLDIAVAALLGFASIEGGHCDW